MPALRKTTSFDVFHNTEIHRKGLLGGGLTRSFKGIKKDLG